MLACASTQVSAQDLESAADPIGRLIEDPIGYFLEHPPMASGPERPAVPAEAADETALTSGTPVT
ncbi:MAG TPA: hypothetical protein VIO94_09395, partial [Phenylobacterium sp.]